MCIHSVLIIFVGSAAKALITWTQTLKYRESEYPPKVLLSEGRVQIQMETIGFRVCASKYYTHLLICIETIKK